MIVKALVVLLIAFFSVSVPAAAQEQLHFADGYHGGYFLTGLAGLRDAFKATFGLLERYPQYKVNLEIESYTIDKLKYGPRDEWEKSQAIIADPATVNALRKYTSEGRLELVGGSYTQPLFFATSGESAIRQFAFGTRTIRDVVGVDTVTYAVQEPCYTSQLPQILNGFGFTQVALKNTWALFGNPPALSKERVQWEGPDGSRIDTSPRYAFNGYSGYVLDIFPSETFLARAIGSGVSRPITFNLGDFIRLSANARIPWFSEKDYLSTTPPYLRYTTWNEYFRGSPPDVGQAWKLAYDDFDYQFPWGLLGGRVQQRASEAEIALLQSEKLAAIAHLARGVPYPAERFEKAWEYLLLAQHHDAWVCAPTSFGGWSSSRTYADWVDVWTAEVERLAGDVDAASIRGIAECIPRPPEGIPVVVCNTLPWEYHGAIGLDEITFPQGVYPQGIRATDPSGREVPLSMEVIERHGDRSIRRAKVQLLASIPAFGYTWFSLSPAAGGGPKPLVSSRSEKDAVVLDSRFFTVRVTSRGIASIYDKDLARELLSGPIGFGGLFPTAGGRQVSTNVRVSRGAGSALSATARAEGSIGGVPFAMDVTLPDARRIDLGISFDFGSQTSIGSIGLNAVEAWTRSEDKLSLLIPLWMTAPRVTADAAFDVYEPVKQDFQAISWVHLSDAESGAGFTVANDRATSYLVDPEKGGMSLAVVLAFGGPFEYAPDKSAPLRGKASYRISLFTGGAASTPFATWRQQMELRQAPRGFVVATQDSGAPDPYPAVRTFVQLVGGEATLEAAYIEGDSLVLRLFNASPNAGTATVLLDAALAAMPVRETRMDGAEIGAVGVEGSAVTLALSPFEVKTLRVGLPTGAGR